MGTSKSFSSSMGQLAPPGMMALIFLPVLEPPQSSSTRKFMGVPMGSS